MADGSDRSTMG